MKKTFILAAALSAALATSAFASQERVTDNCWHKTGNWVGGESYTACEAVYSNNIKPPEKPDCESEK